MSIISKICISLRHKFESYLDSKLQRADLFKVFSISLVGVVESSLEFPDVGLVLLLDARDLGLVAGLNLDQGTLELLNSTGTASPGSGQKVMVSGWPQAKWGQWMNLWEVVSGLSRVLGGLSCEFALFYLTALVKVVNDSPSSILTEILKQ